jgi:hypothetical protein
MRKTKLGWMTEKDKIGMDEKKQDWDGWRKTRLG